MMDKELWTAAEIAEVLRCSKRVAYELMEEKGFPLIRVRRSKYVRQDEFFKWLNGKKQQIS